MAEKRAWLTDPITGEKLHAWAHVKSIFYNKASNILLKDKLDEMDRIIDEKVAKALMSNVQVNDATKVPTSALAYNMQNAITKNAEDITKLNSDLMSTNWTVCIPGVIYRKNKGTTEIKIQNPEIIINAESETYLCTLPEGFRPSQIMRFPVTYGAYNSFCGYAEVLTTGVVQAIGKVADQYIVGETSF